MTAKKTKNIKTAGKKTSPGRGRTSQTGQAGKKASPETVQVRHSGGWNPFAVLIIMALLTVIVVMANKYYTGRKPQIPAKTPVEVVKPDTPVTAKPDSETAQEKTGKKIETAVKPGKDIKPAEVKPLQEKKVKIYFIRLDEPTEKFYLSTVSRNVQGETPLKNALEELIRGPSKTEEKKGYLTAVPGKLKVRKVSVNGNTATVDFSPAIEEGGAGNILLHRVDQIVYTATQFDGIDSVVILVDGKRKSSLGGDGLSISGPLHRKK
jgi:spore germination protein GerM